MKHTSLFAAPVAILTLLGAGCSPAAPSAPSPSGEAPQAAAPAPARAPIAMGNCDNPYYPLRAGQKMEYDSHASGHDSHYSWEVTEATSDHAKLTYHYGKDLSVDSQINCTPQGLRADAYLDLSSAAGGSQIVAKTISSYGELIPADLTPGKVWASGYEVETTNNMPAAVKMGIATSHVMMTTTSTVIGEESVTVPAGTFTAMKVESKMHTHMTLKAGMPAVDSDTTTVEYFVKGKGLVKSTTTASVGGSSSMEATSITIP